MSVEAGLANAMLLRMTQRAGSDRKIGQRSVVWCGGIWLRGGSSLFRSWVRRMRLQLLLRIDRVDGDGDEFGGRGGCHRADGDFCAGSAGRLK